MTAIATGSDRLNESDHVGRDPDTERYRDEQDDENAVSAAHIVLRCQGVDIFHARKRHRSRAKAGPARIPGQSI